MPEERGSIYKTTANEIGEALKAKLGGEGFAPKDWSDNLNLLGIASEDTETAINSLKESEGSGERGSILLSTANAIGSMLNKKYNSQRGFSPAEWASATRKMKALETDTKSGGIVNLKGAKEVPITSLVGTINPTLEGTDTLVATRNGKNLANFVNASGIDASGNIYADSKRCATIDFIPIKSGVSYKVYAENNIGFILAVFNGNTLVRRVDSISSGDTLDTSGGDKFRLCIYGNGTYICTVEADKPRCLTSDDLDTSYTPYVAPTTYTANLGRTIYGGSADIVKGEGEDENGDAFTFDPIPINTSGDTENFYTSNGDTSVTYYEEPTPYTRGSASGMIASIPEANTEFPFTKLKATIAPSVEGVSSVVVKNEGKNLFSFEKDQTITILKTFNLRLFAGSYTFSWDFISTTAETLPVYMQVSFLCEDGTTVYNPVDVIQGRMTRSFTLAKNVTSINIYANTNYTTSDGITTVIENIQLEVGSNATEYIAYKQPTTYTAELGETVFGGSVDLVSGEKVKTYKEITVGNSGWTFYDTGSGTYLYRTVSDKVTPSIGDTSHILVCDILPYGGVNYASQFQDLNVYQANNQNIYIKDNSCASANDYYTKYANMKIGYELATPTESSIEPQEIYPNEGVNNIWNDANGITEVGYFGE